VKDAQKKFGKKFACGASVIENDVIEIQGEIPDELFDYILQEYPQV
jgi:translation initiation factor 1 (eIF-1/SUI1)